MALIAWYKLDGNALDSSENGHHGTASGATWAGGKIGQCGKLTGALSTSIPSASWSVATHSVTLSGWFKFIEADVISRLGQLTYTYNTPTGTLLGYNHYGGFALTWEATHNSGTFSNFRVFGTLRHSNGAYATTTKAVVYGEWAHYAVVFDKNTNVLKLYVDGELLGSTSISSFGQGNYTDRSFYINYGSIYGGNGPSSHMNCFVDDVRVYDHALSPKEVKELAKAKILHYKFDDMQEPTENLIHFQNPRIDDSYDPYVATTSGTWQAKHPDAIRVYNNSGSEITSYVNQGVTDWTNTYHAVWTFDNELKKPVVTMRDLDGQWKAKSFSMGKSMNSLGLNVGDKYTISWLQWTDTPGKRPLVGLYGQNSSGSSGFHDGQGYGQISKANVWERLSHTFTVGSSWNMSANLTLYMYGHYQGRGTLKIADVQMEIKDHATEFIDSHSRTGTVHDSSGYDNHAELALATTPRWVGSEGSKIGSGAYYFPSSADKEIKTTMYMPSDAITMNLWFKSTSVGKDSYHEPLNSDSLYYEISVSSSGQNRTGLYINGSRVVGNYGSGILDGNWHMLTLTFDGTYKKTYLDGVLVNSISSPGSLMGGLRTIAIGKYASSSSYGNLNAYEDDVRIYATALSDEDILELYQTKGSLDNHGNLYASEVMDLDSKILSNGGHVWDFRYGLTSISGLKPLGVE